jgi:beta-aspartyl-peptidase (threonine type)
MAASDERIGEDSAMRASGPAVVIHAGAGPLSDELLERESDVQAALLDALRRARAGLEAGAAAEEGALAAVVAMEDFPLFNAGRGSALCADGSVQMSASVMRGRDRGAGAVAGLRRAINPILGAREVMLSEQVLLVGEAADEWLAERGLEQLANGDFVTERQLVRLRVGAEADRGTVGAVCLDRGGNLAAATSTGGISGQPVGRVGDSPLLGAGTWADRRVAVSCTGDGEAFIRAGVARQIAALVECGVGLAEASERALGEVAARGGMGGLIALDACGRWCAPFTTAAMPRGAWRSGGEAQVHVRDVRALT